MPCVDVLTQVLNEHFLTRTWIWSTFCWHKNAYMFNHLVWGNTKGLTKDQRIIKIIWKVIWYLVYLWSIFACYEDLFLSLNFPLYGWISGPSQTGVGKKQLLQLAIRAESPWECFIRDSRNVTEDLETMSLEIWELCPPGPKCTFSRMIIYQISYISLII